MRLLWLTSVVACAVALSAVAFAAEPGTVANGSTMLFTVAAVPGMTAEQRADGIQKRLVEILSRIRKGEDPGVVVETGKGAPTISVRGILLVTITSRDCALHKCRPDALAKLWGNRVSTRLRIIAPDTSKGAQRTWGD